MHSIFSEEHSGLYRFQFASQKWIFLKIFRKYLIWSAPNFRKSKNTSLQIHLEIKYSQNILHINISKSSVHSIFGRATAQQLFSQKLNLQYWSSFFSNHTFYWLHSQIERVRGRIEKLSFFLFFIRKDARGSIVDCPTRWSLWYWYLDVYVDHLHFDTQISKKYSTAMC